MPLIKTHRGTVLVVQVVFDIGQPNPSVAYVQVFNLGIGGIRRSDFVLDDGSIVPFGNLVPELIGHAAQRVIVCGIFPDGTHLKTDDIPFPATTEVVWSEGRLRAAYPVVDPDWTKNPTMLTVTPSKVEPWPQRHSPAT